MFAMLNKRKYKQFFIIYFLIYIGFVVSGKKIIDQVPTGNDLIGARYCARYREAEGTLRETWDEQLVQERTI